jgi:D-amino peptidase
MKVLISSDIQGTAEIVDWQQVRASGADCELGRHLLTHEVNAAIDGAVEAGATEILVNDSHSTMQDIRPNALHRNASYLSGKHKPLYMMEGLDGTFDAVFMVPYHGAIGAEHAILSHTYNPLAVWEARLNGVRVGESALNALVALHHRLPVVLITATMPPPRRRGRSCPRSRRSWSSARSPSSRPRASILIARAS